MKKTKILLIFPPVTVSYSDYPTPDPPLGLAYLAAFLEKHLYPVKILDCLALGIDQVQKKKNGLVRVGLTPEKIKKFIEAYQPKLVGISCAYTSHAQDAHEIASLVKKIDKKILVVFGGAHSTSYASQVLKDKNVNLVVVGEGEQTFLELTNCLEKNISFNKVPGLCLKIKNKIKFTPARNFISNLDKLPLPSWHLLPMNIYLKKPKMTREFSMRLPRTNIITSRGCVGNCVFCSIHSIWGHHWRPRSPQKVVQEMEYLIKNYKIKEFYLLDDNVSLKKDRLLKICNLIIKKKLNIKWAAPNGIALWTLDREVLKKMKQSGLYRITFGIESASPQTLKFIRKPMILNQAQKIIKICNDLGLWTHSTFIIGFPNETKKEIEKTITWAIKSDLDFATFYLATPYPGTDLYQEFIKHKLLNKNQLNYSSISLSGYDTLRFKKEELNTIRNDAYNRFFASRFKRYLNPFYTSSHFSKKIKTFEDFTYFIRLINNTLGMKIYSLISGKFQSHYK